MKKLLSLLLCCMLLLTSCKSFTQDNINKENNHTSTSSQDLSSSSSDESSSLISSSNTDSKLPPSSSNQSSSSKKPISSSSNQTSSKQTVSSKPSSSNTSTTIPKLPKLSTSFEPLTVTEFYGYNQLDALSQKAYIIILNGLYKMKNDIDLSSLKITQEQAKTVYKTLTSDNPQLFWLDLTYSYSYRDKYIVSFTPKYSLTKEERDARQEQLNTLISSVLRNITVNMSDYEKVKTIHDYLIKHISYDVSISKPDIYNIYGALMNNSSVCDGYTKAFQYFMYQMGMECIYVMGTGNNGPHSWNIVKIDDAYYNIDVTWDDPIVNGDNNNTMPFYTYFNVTDEQIKKDHIFEEYAYSYPKCTSTKAAYKNN